MARRPSAFERRNTRGGQLPRFLSREAGQARTQNLKQVERSILDTIRYYGGPGLGDRTIPAALNTVPELLPGADIRDATIASGEIADAVQNRDPWQGMFGGLGLLGSMGMAVLPGTASGLRGAVDEVAGAGARAASPSVAAAEALDPLAGPAVPPAIRAYHGTPHDFDRFDMGKLGTGEGAQAYGRGLYFAGNEDVATMYRKNLTQGGGQSPTQRAKDYLDRYGGDRGEAAKQLRTALDGSVRPSMNPPVTRQWEESLALLEGDADLSKVSPPGRTYEVAIKADPEDLLDWDNPLNETQGPLAKYLAHIGKTPDEVVDFHDKYVEMAEDWLKTGDPETRARWDAMGEDPLVGLGGIVADLRAPPDAYGYKPAAAKATGERMLKALGGTHSDEAIASLREAGIPGIRYRDAGSRGDDIDDELATYNYVISDDKLIDIVRKYGIAALLGGGAAGAAATNGRDDKDERKQRSGKGGA